MNVSRRYDYLKIVNDKGKRVGTFCGELNGYKIFLSGDQILITFHSDASYTKRGFRILFTATIYSKYTFFVCSVYTKKTKYLCHIP